MKKGITNVIIFYALVLAATWLVYALFEVGRDGMGLYILVPSAAFVLGVIWISVTVFSYYFKGKTDLRKGVIFANAFFLLIIVGIVFYSRNRNKIRDVGNEIEENLDTKMKGDTILTEYKGVKVFLSIKDSVYIDQMDSLRSTLK